MTREQLKQAVMRHLAGDLACIEATEAVTDYLEGRLGVVAWLRFQLHLGLCPGCRVYLLQMKQTVRALGRLPAGPAPADVRLRLLARWRNRRGRAHPPAP